MFATRRGFLQGFVATVAGTMLPVPGAWAAPSPPTTSTLHVVAAPVVRAQDELRWRQIGPSADIKRLFTPTSGALYAQSADALYRTDNIGERWTKVALPEPRRTGAAVEVDPTNHDIIYAESNEGLQQTLDGGTTWTTIVPTDRRTLRLAISPADPNVLYHAQTAGAGTDYWFSRSQDRGATWEQLDERHLSLCGWGVNLLTPHQTDPSRVFRTIGCYAGRDLRDDLEESRDFGRTWKAIAAPKGAFPRYILGGAAGDPSRLVLAANHDPRSGGSTIFLSTDDGATWTPTLEHTGGGSMGARGDRTVTVTGLTFIPQDPATVYSVTTSMLPPSTTTGVATPRVSRDGGATWEEFSGQLAEIHDLALGIDGRNLFAASAYGVARLQFD